MAQYRYGLARLTDAAGSINPKGRGFRLNLTIWPAVFGIPRTSTDNGLCLAIVVDRKGWVAPLRGEATLDVSLAFTPR
jgi:hypothetical protein